jgi:energy-converting hydrogenase Eha subunit A
MEYLIPLPIQDYIYEHEKTIRSIMISTLVAGPCLILGIGVITGGIYTETDKAFGICYILVGVISAAISNYSMSRGEWRLFSHLV